MIRDIVNSYDVDAEPFVFRLWVYIRLNHLITQIDNIYDDIDKSYHDGGSYSYTDVVRNGVFNL